MLKIGYEFKDQSLLKQALTHASLSYKKSSNVVSYERLEFLGDSILSAVMATIIYKKFPDDSEGDLSKKLSYLVSGEILSQVSANLDIGSLIKMSKGEEISQGRCNKKILEDVIEALIGAIYLDSSSIDVCSDFISRNWEVFINQSSHIPENPITKLQEVTQGLSKKLPIYEVNKVSGDAHNPKFHCVVRFQKYSADGFGESKKNAKCDAAKNILQKISL